MCELWTLNIFIGKAIFTSSQPEPTNILGWINFVVVRLSSGVQVRGLGQAGLQSSGKLSGADDNQ